MMTHRSHTLPATAHAYRLGRATSISLAALGTAAMLAAIAWSIAGSHVQSSARQRALAEVRTAIVIGMTRENTYAILREHGLVAVNPAYAAWTKNALGVWYRSDDGAWPRAADRRPTLATALPLNPTHPEVMVKLSTAADGDCGVATIEQILFDRTERIKHIAYSTPYWTCQ